MLTLALFLQVDRLMELHFKYLEAVQLADKRIEGEKHVRFTHTHSRLIGSISSARADLCVKIRADLPESNECRSTRFSVGPLAFKTERC